MNDKDIKRIAEAYSGNFQGFTRQVVRWRPYICPFEHVLAHVPPKSRVLDIGCGSGFVLDVCRQLKESVRTVGVDAHAGRIQKAVSIASQISPAPDFEFKACSDPEQWPLEKFDAVLLIDVLHHISLDKHKQFVKAAMDRTMPGGFLIIKDMSKRPIWMALMNRLHDFVLSRQMIHYPNLNEFVEIAKSEFTLIDSRADITFWYSHELIVLRRDTETSSK